MKSVRFSLFALVLMWCSWHTLQAQDSIYLSLSARIENDTLILNVHPVRFTDIVSCRFGIRYPYADLDYVRATGNPLLQGAAVSGNQQQIGFGWISGPPAPTTIPDFSSIAEFRFFIKNRVSPYCFDFDVAGLKPEMSNSQASGLPVRGIPLCQNFLNGTVKGIVRQDRNNDCLADLSEPGLPSISLIFTDGNNDYYTLTKEDGSFELDLPMGVFNLKLKDRNDLRQFCQNTGQINFTTPGQIIELKETAKDLILCSELWVHLTTPKMRLCSDIEFSVDYENLGTVDAQNAYVDVQLDPQLTFIKADLAGTLTSANTYRFLLNTVPANKKGHFKIVARTNCDPQYIGRTLCSQAVIYPRNPCKIHPAYSGAELQIVPRCENDSVVFNIKNIGTGDMKAELSFTTVEDDVMPGYSGKINLLQNQSQEIRLPAFGKTKRIVFDTIPYHPYRVRPTAALEGCGLLPNGDFSKGFINNFSLGDEAPQVSDFCAEIKSSFDPNDKIASPEGMSGEHFIRSDNRLNYTIRFQNTGNDTAFSVVILDKMDPLLDLGSLQIEASSHPVDWLIQSDRTLKFIFRPISLPDSSSNFSESQGFISYSIVPNTSVKRNQIIRNYSEILFDFNPPVRTNTYIHTIGEYTFTATNDNIKSDILVKVYPNPFAETLTFMYENKNNTEYRLEIFDIKGNTVFSGFSNEGTILVKANGIITVGEYLYKITSNGNFLQNGKIIKNY